MELGGVVKDGPAKPPALGPSEMYSSVSMALRGLDTFYGSVRTRSRKYHLAKLARPILATLAHPALAMLARPPAYLFAALRRV